jgi:hypothetical protein
MGIDIGPNEATRFTYCFNDDGKACMVYVLLFFNGRGKDASISLNPNWWSCGLQMSWKIPEELRRE